MVIPVSSLPPKEQSITYENKNIVWTFKAGFIIYHFKILVHYCLSFKTYIEERDIVS